MWKCTQASVRWSDTYALIFSHFTPLPSMLEALRWGSLGGPVSPVEHEQTSSLALYALSPYEQQRREDNDAKSSVLHLNEIYRKLKPFVMQWRASTSDKDRHVRLSPMVPLPE